MGAIDLNLTDTIFPVVTERANHAKDIMYEINTDKYDGWVSSFHHEE